MGDTLLLFDAYSLIYRAFYAIRTLTGPDGEPVNAIFGLTKMLRKLLADHHPGYCAIVFDLGAPQKRLRLLTSYKAQRPPTPPDLEKQLAPIREVLQAMRVPIVEKESEEADDIIATLAVHAARLGHDVLIASNDKDFLQIVDARVRMLRPDGKETAVIDPVGVEARCGVKPGQIVDYLSLIGDTVDNIPGAPGVGEKTAAQLLVEYGTIDQLLARVGEISKPKLRDSLVASADRLRLNRQLIALQTDVPLSITLDALKVQPPDATALAALFRRFGFKSLLAEVEKSLGTTPGEMDLFAPK